jgi:GNAT superfamily N-acetyltransferase
MDIALSVEPEMRLRNIGTALFEAIAGKFKKEGISKMRTMVASDARLPLLFFRGEG